MRLSDRSLLPPGSPKPPAPESNRPYRWHRTIAFVAVAAVTVLALGLGADRWVSRGGTLDQPAKSVGTVATTTITRNDISTKSSLDGTLGYGAARKVTGSLSGVVTWLPRPGATIARGKQAYRVNDRPIPLFYGKIPLYRDLRKPGTVGRDVRLVADNLRSLGYRVGAQPAPGTVVTRSVPVDDTPAAAGQPTPVPTASATGKLSSATGEPADTTVRTRTIRTTVHDGEAVLTVTLIAAIKAWQQDLELPANGRLSVGSVLVLPKAFRVSALSAQVGDPATGELFSATATSKVITVSAEESTAASIDRGDRATVELSDSSTTSARVTSISTALQAPEGGDGSSPKLDITLVLDHPSKLKRVDSGNFQVLFASETHKQVLTVAVSALLALSEGGYALQPTSGPLIPVETGIFAADQVEVSGPAVTEGLSVVTTS